MKEYRENSDALASTCAANLASLGRLYVRDGRFGIALEVLALAAKLGSLEAQAEIVNYRGLDGHRKRHRITRAQGVRRKRCILPQEDMVVDAQVHARLKEVHGGNRIIEHVAAPGEHEFRLELRDQRSHQHSGRRHDLLGWRAIQTRWLLEW